MKVDWDEDVCVHSGKCVKDLPKVFRVEAGEFIIDENAATEEEIKAAVGNCPSGALKLDEG